VACLLAWALDTWHRRRGRTTEAVAVWRVGLAAAEKLGDRSVAALARRMLGVACARAGRHAEALANLEQALVLSENDPAGQAHTHHLLACAWELRHDDARALTHARRALALFATLDLPVWQGWALDQVGWHEARLGEHEVARTHCEAALELLRAHHDQEGQAVTLDSLGYIACLTGRYTDAVAHYRAALDLFREMGDTYEEPATLDHLAEALHAVGDVSGADTAWQQALELCRSQHRTTETLRIQQRWNEAR
jgi:tetratricopeptide (TPR) repeat protein